MTDLTDRMRTCAAYIMERPRGEPMPTDGADLKVVLDRIELVLDDAADLLIEASNIIEEAKLGTVLVDDETAKALGLPMEVMKPWVEDPLAPQDKYRAAVDKINRATDADLWIAPGGPLPGLTRAGTISPRACPKCDSRANKRVSRQGTHLMLVCPVCAHVWPYAKKPLAEGPGAAE